MHPPIDERPHSAKSRSRRHPGSTVRSSRASVIDFATVRRTRWQREMDARELEHLESLRDAPVETSSDNTRWKEAESRASAAKTAPARRSRAAQQKVRAKCPPCHWGLLVLSLLLAVLSIPIVYSASIPIALNNHETGANTFLWKQCEFAGIGALVLFFASRISAIRLRQVMWILYAVTLVGLILTAFTPLGLVMGGVKRWFHLGPIQWQFSELAKIVLIGVMADYWSHAAKHSHKSLRPWTMAAALALPFVLLVLKQPHLSAASLLFMLPLAIAYFAGVPLGQIGQVVVIALCGAVLMLTVAKACHLPFIQDYQIKRVTALTGKSDERGANYQKVQGIRALIRGGIFGAGPGKSLYKEGHLPAPHTDYIMAVTGEEWGMAGLLGLLAMYGAIIFFCFYTAHEAAQPFEMLVCSGVGTLLAIQLFCNAGVVTGILPVTGMPLPMLSYGGSGLICSLLGIGFVLSVSRRGAWHEVPEAAPEAPVEKARQSHPRRNVHVRSTSPRRVHTPHSI